MSDLTDLYQSVILDHNRRPRNKGAMEHADAHAEGKNPLCGDQLSVWVKYDDDRIADVRFEGQGCAISQASASLMTQAVKGKTRGEALALFDRVHEMVLGHTPPPADARGPLGALAALSGVSRFPIRVKCASLAWHTLRAALAEATPDATPTVTTE
jgi:nitrogen fixation NifU-like protein